MAADAKLRPLLARLDWGSEQEFRSTATLAILDYQQALPVALALGLGVFLALVAIAVILAVH